MKKKVIIDIRAKKEIDLCPFIVRIDFYSVLKILEENGRLEEPDAKKLGGKQNLFEIRIRLEGQWRFIYSYLADDIIVVLCAFCKKTQKTPVSYLELAKKRLKYYL